MPPKGYKNKSEQEFKEWEEYLKEICKSYYDINPNQPKETIEGKQANPNKETEE